jgi:hypothetical protein
MDAWTAPEVMGGTVIVKQIAINRHTLVPHTRAGGRQNMQLTNIK